MDRSVHKEFIWKVPSEIGTIIPSFYGRLVFWTDTSLVIYSGDLNDVRVSRLEVLECDPYKLTSEEIGEDDLREWIRISTFSEEKTLIKHASWMNLSSGFITVLVGFQLLIFESSNKRQTLDFPEVNETSYFSMVGSSTIHMSALSPLLNFSSSYMSWCASEFSSSLILGFEWFPRPLRHHGNLYSLLAVVSEDTVSLWLVGKCNDSISVQHAAHLTAVSIGLTQISAETRIVCDTLQSDVINLSDLDGSLHLAILNDVHHLRVRFDGSASSSDRMPLTLEYLGASHLPSSLSQEVTGMVRVGHLLFVLSSLDIFLIAGLSPVQLERIHASAVVSLMPLKTSRGSEPSTGFDLKEYSFMSCSFDGEILCWRLAEGEGEGGSRTYSITDVNKFLDHELSPESSSQQLVATAVDPLHLVLTTLYVKPPMYSGSKLAQVNRHLAHTHAQKLLLLSPLIADSKWLQEPAEITRVLRHIVSMITDHAGSALPLQSLTLAMAKALKIYGDTTKSRSAVASSISKTSRAFVRVESASPVNRSFFMYAIDQVTECTFLLLSEGSMGSLEGITPESFTRVESGQFYRSAYQNEPEALLLIAGLTADGEALLLQISTGQ